MAAVAELVLLLFAFISNIHAEESVTILEEKSSYTIKLPEENNFCQISRFVGDQKFVLWNSSKLWAENTTAPEHLQEHGPFLNRVNISAYTIHNLTHSDSGLYQVECWTKGTMTTHKKNISITVCSGKHEMRRVQGKFGETVDLLCEGAADNLTVYWLQRQYEDEQEEKWTRVSSKMSLMNNEEDRLQVGKNTSTLRVSKFSVDVFGPYTCLVMDKQHCISSHPVAIVIQSEVIYHSVGGTAVLHCAVTNVSDDQPLYWINNGIPVKSPQNVSDSFSNFTEQQQNVSLVNPEINRNNSLVLSSLSVNNTGVYTCMRSSSYTSYFLVVCPEFGPPAVEYFSEADVVTLRCNHSLGRNAQRPIWFMITDKAEGTIVKVNQFYKQQSSVNGGLRNRINMSISFDNVVLSNVSVEDRGEYWCAVFDQNTHCVFTAKTLLIYRGPLWIYFTPYVVRSLLLVIPCVVVLTVIHRSRRIEQLSDI